MSTSSAADTSEQCTQQQQQQQQQPHRMHSTFPQGGHLQRPPTTEINLPTSCSDLSLTDDYGVKSMDDFCKPVENITLPVDNIPITASTGTLTQPPTQRQITHHGAAPKEDDTSNNTSSYDEDDSFSCLTGDISQPCFYDHANDSTATWLSGMSDSNIDLVVPKVNIRPTIQPPSQFIGYLSIMLCGDSGIGKSLLVQAFSLMPEIMDGRLYTQSETTENGDTMVMDIPNDKNISAEIKESYASTLPQSKQAGDKNICFIETPGYGAFVDAKAVIRSTTKYLERQFQQTNNMLSPTHPSTPKLARLLHNLHGGHSHVDVCLYLILDRIKPVDIEYLRSIQHLCNIIPVIVKTDLLSSGQEQVLKRKILHELHDNNIEFYQCGYSFEQLLELCQKQDDALDMMAPPFSISTKSLTNKHYHKTHSAKGYLKLVHLKDTLFYKHTDALRLATVTKFFQWRREQTSIQQAYRSQQRHYPSSTSSSFTTVSQQDQCLTTMMDLETMTQKLATREIAERIQDLASKQRRTINLHMANYVNEQRQRLEQQKQERLIQLQQKYHIMTQQEKASFLTNQLNGLLAECGLLPGELNSGFLLSQQQKGAATTSSSMSSSIWHLYPPPDVIDHLVFLRSTPVYILVGILLLIMFIGGLTKWWWSF